MYSVTTDTGLTLDVANLIDLGEAVHAQVAAHGGERSISYTITRDGTPQYDSWIDVSTGPEGAEDFIRTSLQRLVDAIIIEAAYEAHRTQASS